MIEYQETCLSACRVRISACFGFHFFLCMSRRGLVVGSAFLGPIWGRCVAFAGKQMKAPWPGVDSSSLRVVRRAGALAGCGIDRARTHRHLPKTAMHTPPQAAQPASRPLGARGAVSLAALAAALLLASCNRVPAPPKAELDALKANCVNAMVSSTCRVMQGQGLSLVPKDAQTVFVAGIGPIDAALYRSLREQGDGMCQHLATVCEKDWAGAQCQTARKLYAAPAS